MNATRDTARLLAVAVATAVAIGGCGGGEDGGGRGPASVPDSQAPTTADRPAGDRAQIQALAELVQRSFGDGDGAALCAGLAAAGQRDLVAYGRALGLRGPCAAVIAAIAKGNRAQGIEQKAAEVVTIRVRGRRAVALVRTANVAPVRQHYVRVGDEWKIRSLGLAAAVGAGGGN